MMEKDILLFEYLEGNLDSQSEDVLFGQLKTDYDLRNKMRKMIAVNTAVKDGIKTLGPSAETTLKVFGTLGFTTAATTVAKATGSKSLLRGTGSAIKRRFSSPLFSAVTSSIMTVAVVFILFNAGLFDNSPQLKEDLQSSGLNHNKIPVLTSAEEDEASALEQNKTSSYNETNEHINNNIDNKFKEIKNKNVFQKANIEQESALNSIKEKDLFVQESEEESAFKAPQILNLNSSLCTKPEAIALYKNTSAREITFRQPQHFVPVDNNSTFIFGRDMYVEVNKFSDWHLNTSETSSSRFLTDDISVSAVYRVNDYVDLGGEFRKEKFYITDSKEISGIQEGIDEFNNCETWSALIRYRFAPDGKLIPVGQFSLGINSTGQVGRLLGGVVYNPTDRISVSFGLEYSTMNYKFLSETLNSGKFGLNYGLKYNL